MMGSKQLKAIAARGHGGIEVADNGEGIAPENLTKIFNHEGIALSDYSAKELTVGKGMRVEIQKKMNGWSWCRTESGEEGWLPDDAIGF